jgi:hypothetical protein
MFINLREAAYRSGWAMESIAGRCRREWAAMGLAIQAKPSDGTSKTCWHVREDADRAFARSKSPDLLPFDERDLTTKQRQVFHRRRELLDAWMESRAEGFAAGRQTERQITEAFVERCRIAGDCVSRGTLYRWLNDFCAKGKAGLVDARVKSHQVEPDRKWFEDQLERLYLSRRRSMRLSYDRAVDMAEDLGRPVPYGYKTAQRFLSSLDEKVVMLKREGKRAYDAKFGRYIKRSHDIAANDLWMSDGHKFDVQVMYQGKRTRPILVSWMDIASRLIVGYTIEPKSETADAIRISLKRGVQAFGTPQRVYIDNGSSYDAEHLQGITKAQRRAGQRASIDIGIFPRLGIEVTHAKTYNAKAKGELERFHRTICDRFSCELPGYMSGNPLNKPHTYAGEVKAGKLIGYDEFCERFDDWLIADYHHREHTGDGMEGKSPAVVFAERMREKRTLPADKMELELCRRTRVTVGRNGVSIKLHGATLCFEAAELDVLSGETVDVILDDDRVDQASVYRLDGSRLCVATAVASVSIMATPEELREAMKGRRRDRKLDAQAQDVRMRIADDPWERMHRNAVEAAAASPVPMPDSIQPVRTPEPPPMRLAGTTLAPADDDDYYSRYADIEPRKAVP